MSSFDKVIGYKSVKAELGRIADIIKNPQKYEKYGVSFPKGIVLYGEPGVRGPEDGPAPLQDLHP